MVIFVLVTITVLKENVFLVMPSTAMTTIYVPMILVMLKLAIACTPTMLLLATTLTVAQ